MAGIVAKIVHLTWLEIKIQLKRCQIRHLTHLLQGDKDWATVNTLRAPCPPLRFSYSLPIAFK